MLSTLAALFFGVGALLLVLGGALKLVDPSGSVGALRTLGLPVGDAAVRAFAGIELVLGAIALAAAGAVVALLVAVSYAGFAVVTVLALVRGVPIDSCGCLGRFETPPSWRHLVVVGAVAAGSVGVAFDPGDALIARVGDGAGGVLFAVATVVLMAIAVVVMRSGRRPIAAR